MTTLAPVSLVDRVHQLISSGEFQLPPLPELALRLQNALKDESVNAKQIADLIQNDPAIAASLLRAANSAAFGGMKAVTDLSQAIARLGLKQIETMVTALLVQGQFESNRESKRQVLEMLWSHAIASATVARKLARREGYPPEDAFMAGLLHGIGRLIVLRALDQLSQRDPELSPTPAAVDELVETLQYELGYSTLREWNLAEDICEAARAMAPDADLSSSLVVRIVQASDAFAQKLGMHPTPDPDLNLLDHDAVEAIELAEIELAAMLVDLEDEVEELRAAFRSS